VGEGRENFERRTVDTILARVPRSERDNIFIYFILLLSGCHAIVVIILFCCTVEQYYYFFKYCMFVGSWYRAERRRMDFVNLIRIHCSPSRGTRRNWCTLTVCGLWSSQTHSPLINVVFNSTFVKFLNLWKLFLNYRILA